MNCSVSKTKRVINLIFLLILLSILSFSVSGFVYYENATAYDWTFGGGIANYYFNYTIEGNESQIVWKVKHGKLDTYYIYIPSECNNTNLQFRIYQNGNAFSCETQPKCYNGSAWIDIGNQSFGGDCGCSYSRGQQTPNELYDGDWDSNIYYPNFQWGNDWRVNCSTPSCELIYEEALIVSYNASEVICEADWSCSGYGSCNTSDLAPCNNVTDSNSCPQNYVYTGDYSEFTPQSCDYCTPSWNCSNYGSCNISDLRPCNETTDSNNCYAQTSLPSDDYSGNYSEFSPQACDYCTPDFSCDGYALCGIDDERDCNSTNDSNNCYAQTSLPSDDYSGNYSEFISLVCNYCSASFINYSLSDCALHLQEYCIIDENWTTCCNITGIGEDCLYGMEIYCVNETCSLFDYDEGDIGEATISMFAKYFITIQIFIIVIILVFVYSWGYEKVMKK